LEIVQTLTPLGRTLKMPVTAAGVETQEQSVLRQAGCRYGQRFYFARRISNSCSNAMPGIRGSPRSSLNHSNSLPNPRATATQKSTGLTLKETSASRLADETFRALIQRRKRAAEWRFCMLLSRRKHSQLSMEPFTNHIN
jgi:EAL domain-containing protein (putative c-di-GMP-specific phosphodiesterase class I)